MVKTAWFKVVFSLQEGICWCSVVVLVARKVTMALHGRSKAAKGDISPLAEA